MPQRLLDEYTVVVVFGFFFCYKAKSDNCDGLDGDDDGGHFLHQQARQWFHHPVHLTTLRLPHPQKAPQPGWPTEGGKIFNLVTSFKQTTGICPISLK